MNLLPAMRTLLASCFRIYRHVVLDSLDMVRHQGARELLRRRGWRFAGAVLGYYLVRDTVVYVLLPLWLARGLR